MRFPQAAGIKGRRLVNGRSIGKESAVLGKKSSVVFKNQSK